MVDEMAIVKVAEILLPEDFYEPRHRHIYSAMMGLYKTGEPIDVLTVNNYLKKHKLIAKSGGTGYLSEVIAHTSTAANVSKYAEQVKEAAIRRRFIGLAGRIGEIAYQEDRELTDIINEIESSVYSMTNASVQSDFVHAKDLLAKSFEITDDMSSEPGKIRGVKTGFPSLDRLLSGLNRSDLLILAARPAVGKSSFALDIARHAAIHEGKTVGFFSLEMSDVQIMDRILAIELGANLFNLRTGQVGDRVFSKFSNVADKIAKSNLYIDDTPGQSIIDIRTKSRKLKVERGLDLLIVDYLQLIQGMRRENRVQEVSDISRTLKLIARELEIPVLALAQLSRAVEQRVDKRPQLSDLRESGSIEQDADIVMFLQRQGQFDPDADNRGAANLYVAKHRNGPTGNIDLVFIDKVARFRELSKVR